MFSERWKSSQFPVVCPLLVYDKRTKNAAQDESAMLKPLTKPFQELLQGIDVDGFRIFGIVTAILGDLPGRCEFGKFQKFIFILAGVKVSTFANKCCRACEMINDDLDDSFVNTETYEERN